MTDNIYIPYIEAAKAKQGFKYDNQLDNALSFKGSMICRLRKGTSDLSEEKMLELAELGGKSPAVALADLNVMRSSGQTKGIYEKMREAVAMLSIMAMVIITGASPALANCQAFGADLYIMGIKRWVRRNTLKHCFC